MLNCSRRAIRWPLSTGVTCEWSPLEGTPPARLTPWKWTSTWITRHENTILFNNILFAYNSTALGLQEDDESDLADRLAEKHPNRGRPIRSYHQQGDIGQGRGLEAIRQQGQQGRLSKLLANLLKMHKILDHRYHVRRARSFPASEKGWHHPTPEKGILHLRREDGLYDDPNRNPRRLEKQIKGGGSGKLTK